MEKSYKKFHGPWKPSDSTKTTSSGCACGCKGSVPEYEDDDFIIEEDEY